MGIEKGEEYFIPTRIATKKMDITSVFGMMRSQVNWNPCTLLMGM